MPKPKREVERYGVYRRKTDGSLEMNYLVALDPPAGRQLCSGCGRRVRRFEWMKGTTGTLVAICSRCDAPW